MTRLLILLAVCLLLAGGTLVLAQKGDGPNVVQVPPGGGAVPPGGGPFPLGGGAFPPGAQPPGGFPGGGPPGFPGQPVPPGGRNQYKELIPVLIAALGDDDSLVRQSAAHALTRIGTAAVAPLHEVLKDKEKHAQVRANAAYVLAQIGSGARELLPTLTKALKEPDRELRRRAAYAIARLVEADSGNRFGPPGIGGFPGAPMGGFDRGGRSASPSTKLPDPGLVLPTEKDGPKPEPKEGATAPRRGR